MSKPNKPNCPKPPAPAWKQKVKQTSHGQYRGLRITPIKHWVQRGNSSN